MLSFIALLVLLFVFAVIPVQELVPTVQFFVMPAGQDSAGVTVTVVFFNPLETPWFQHSSEYDVVTEGYTVSVSVPLNVFHPVHPPDAQHESAVPPIVHVKFDELPVAIVVGDAERVSVGAGIELFVAEQDAFVPPFAPAQSQLYVPSLAIVSVHAGVPAKQMFALGCALTVVPCDEPQLPLTAVDGQLALDGVVAEHEPLH